MTTTDSRITGPLAGGKAVVAAPGEPDPLEWERRAKLLLRALDEGLVPSWGRESFIAGWLAGAYRHGYWDAKLTEVAPGFRCDHCGLTSHHPADIAHGYCGACHHVCAEVTP